VERAQQQLADALYEYVTARRPVREPSKLELARDLVTAPEAKERLEATNKVLAPKAGKWEAFMNAEGLIGMTELADILGTNVRQLTGWLVDRGIYRKQTSEHGGRRNLPRATYRNSGHFEVKFEEKTASSSPSPTPPPRASTSSWTSGPSRTPPDPRHPRAPAAHRGAGPLSCQAVVASTEPDELWQWQNRMKSFRELPP
jgi:phage antirepressor YoqD-like protein